MFENGKHISAREVSRLRHTHKANNTNPQSKSLQTNYNTFHLSKIQIISLSTAKERAPGKLWLYEYFDWNVYCGLAKNIF